MIEIAGLRYTYPAAKRPALDDLSLHVSQGELVAVVGPTGSGKSTLCYALAGFIPSFFRGEVEGRLRVAGLDPIAGGPAPLAGTVALVFQDPFSQISGARFTVTEEVAFGLENLGVPREEMRPRVEQALRLVGLSGLSDRSPYELSGGEQQRLALASILVLRPRLLILDEPTSQLDPQGARQVIEAIDHLTEDRSTTVILVENRLEWLAAYADRAIVLHRGKVADDGPPKQVLTAPEVERLGVRRTRYARAAEVAHRRGWRPSQAPLPATLSQAVSFFR